jgi:hypothetical protein
MNVRALLIAGIAIGLAAFACIAQWRTFAAPVKWAPDALYYQARVLELRGTPHDVAMKRTFEGPISAKVRREDPEHTGNQSWVRYNEPFYQRRVAVPLAAAAIYPLAGNRSLLYVSLAGDVAAVLAIFGLLLLRFRLVIATAVATATAFLPALVNNSSYPMTDSWGLTFEIVAFAAALLTLDRSRRWIPLWVAALALLAFTRDSAWVPIFAAGWCALRFRSRSSMTLFVSGLLAALPAVLLFRTPARDLLALLVNHSNVPTDRSWSFVVSHYPHAVVELIRANVGFLRRGEWYTTVYLVGGVVALLALVRQRRVGDLWPSLLRASVFLGLGYVLAAPVFSAFRLELVFVPMAAYGLALATELAASRAGALDWLAMRTPARMRRS